MGDAYKSMGLLPDVCGRSVSWDVCVEECASLFRVVPIAGLIF